MSNTNPTPREIHDLCVCLGLQRAARNVARRYDEAFRPLGLSSGQFAILSVIGGGPMPLTEAAHLLGQERTTLTRNLRPLEAFGLVETLAHETDSRVRLLTLTRKGRAQWEAAIPQWRRAQAESAKMMKDENWGRLKPALERLS